MGEHPSIEHDRKFRPIGEALRERVMPALIRISAHWQERVTFQIRDMSTGFNVFGEGASTIPTIYIIVVSLAGRKIMWTITSDEPDVVSFGRFPGERQVLPLHEFTDRKIGDFFNELIDASLNAIPPPATRPFLPSAYKTPDFAEIALRQWRHRNRYLRSPNSPDWSDWLIGFSLALGVALLMWAAREGKVF